MTFLQNSPLNILIHRIFMVISTSLMRVATFSILLFTLPVQATESLPSLVNQLGQSSSPYLLAHREDPVAWQEWNAATIERARKENKLLYLSIGYFSCHWCHVMQKESYQNPEIAAIINQHFIPVKVDRELNVALDAQMIEYAEARLGVSGWPLNVFVTPDGYPLYAILYQPAETFRKMLDVLSAEWLKDSAALSVIAHKTAPRTSTPTRIKIDRALSAMLTQRLQDETIKEADMLAGGFNVPRKFPIAPQLGVLLEMEKRQHNPKLAEWLKLTLDHMMNGGLRDHLGGGFFRYTTDPAWQHPHFEKMLYDNAQLASIYLHAAEILHQPVYRDIAIQTLDFMLRDMMTQSGMITSISALDSNGKEGGVYLWTEEQLQHVLSGQELEFVKKIWGMHLPVEHDAGYLPLNHTQPSAAEKTQLQEIYIRLMEARNTRISPIDTKQLASLNGLALTAFSDAAHLSPRYREAADKLKRFITTRLLNGNALDKGYSLKALGNADLDGYAYVAQGLQRHAEITGKKEDARLADELVHSAWKRFYTERGFALEEKNEWGRIQYQPMIDDSPLPSPSATLIQASLRSGDKTLIKHAHNALSLSSPMLKHGLLWNATQVSAINRAYASPVKPR